MPTYQRRRADRRRRGEKHPFPFRDAQGVLVRAERRKLPDRRLVGIETEWLAALRSAEQ